jgi:vancomycin resistance protein VanW
MVTSDAKRSATSILPIAVLVTQPIRKSDYWQGKLFNLNTAASRLDSIILEPGKIFSFWNLVGPPQEENGFTVGRSIRDDQIEADVGGGLCQLSGLVYELGLRSGMEIVERYPHSQDLYTEESRFTPLGLDATVVWGHKDLRLLNPLNQRLILSFEITDETIQGRIHADSTIPLAEIVIDRSDHADRFRAVSVSRKYEDGRREVVSKDEYTCAVQVPMGERSLESPICDMPG